MLRTRVLWPALAAVAVALVLSSAAGAFPARPAGDHTLTTTHFVITYYTDVAANGDPGNDYSTETDAGDIAGYAEQAYALYRSWGFAAPPDDGDGHIDIQVTDLSGPPAYPSTIDPDPPFGSPDTGFIQLATPTQLKAFADGAGLTVPQEEQFEVARSLFFLFAWGTWLPSQQQDEWIQEGAAQWAGYVASGYPAVTGSVGPPDIALSCRDNLADHQMCDPTPYFDEGYGRWAFFQQLANEYGPNFVIKAFANAALGQTATTALSNAIAAKGSSLSSEFNTYAENLMNANFGVPGLSTVRPDADATIATGIKTTTLPPVTVTPINHLAARFVNFTRGDGNSSHECYAATLAISVALPAGTSSQPYFLWDVPGNNPQPLSVSGNTASITLPWDTCFWGTTVGRLSIPNAGTTVDGANFVVSSSLTVDQNTPATAATPPPAASIWGTTVPVPTTDAAPTIDVFGPELLQVSSTSPTIRLIVESSGAGTVNAALGATVLGTGQLRAGNNDLRWTLPKSMLTSLRSSASASNLLTLTPMSTSGAASGSPVMLHVVVTAPPKAKKPKPKKHPKK